MLLRSRKNFSHGLFAIALALVITSCGTSKHAFDVSAVEPAARGNVKVSRDNNSNYVVDVEVMHLAGPERLPIPKSVYVVWADTESGAQNLGQLRPDNGLFSKTIKANLKTSTPYQPRRIFVTAEDAPTITSPGNYIVLNMSNF